MANPTRNNGRSDSSNHNEFNEYVDIASQQIDKIVFEPYFKTQISQSKEKNMTISTVFDANTLKKIDGSLKSIKVSCFALALLCGAYCLSNLSRPKGFLFGIVAYDLLRISYNCYTKNYCYLAVDSLSGDFKKLGSTILKVASSALGTYSSLLYI